MAESIASDTYFVLDALKNNNTGNISIKNGRIYHDGANTYTTIGGNTGAPPDEAVRAEDSLSFTRCENFTGSGDLTATDGNIRVTGFGSVTLV